MNEYERATLDPRASADPQAIRRANLAAMAGIGESLNPRAMANDRHLEPREPSVLEQLEALLKSLEESSMIVDQLFMKVQGPKPMGEDKHPPSEKISSVRHFLSSLTARASEVQVRLGSLERML